MTIKNCSMDIQSIKVFPDKKVWVCTDKIITFWDDGKTTTEEVTNSETEKCVKSKEHSNMDIQHIEVSKDKRVIYCEDKIITYWFDGRTTTEVVTNSEAKECVEPKEQ